jgi:hypothetical protein
MTNRAFPSRLILAPSLAGKSTWVAKQDRRLVADGDDVISGLGLWPDDPEWWRGPLALTVHRRHAAVLASYARNTNKLIVFNGHPEALAAAFKHTLVVIPALSVLISRINSRPGRFPSSPADVRANVKTLREFAIDRGLPIFTAFPDLD